MHIPDGYLSPQSYLPLWGLAALAWGLAAKRLKGALTRRQVPYLAMAAAFCFLIQMFNVPVPGGASGHAVGAAVMVLLLGPAATVLGVSVVLFMQALIFGDGGITALGPNALNMAVVMPLVAYYTFKLVGRPSTAKLNKPRRLYAGAFLAGYLGLTASAVSTGFMLGIQPLIAAAPDGTPLYAPYPLGVALPAMAISHLLVFGVIEGILTMVIFRYFMKNEPDLIYALGPQKTKAAPEGPA